MFLCRLGNLYWIKVRKILYNNNIVVYCIISVFTKTVVKGIDFETISRRIEIKRFIAFRLCLANLLTKVTITMCLLLSSPIHYISIL